MSNEGENSSVFWRMIDRFWMQEADLRSLDVMRRCYGLVLLCKVALIWPDRHLFFGSGSYLPPESARNVLDPDAWSLYSFAPDSPWTITIALSILLATGLSMILSKFTRVAAIIAFPVLVAIDNSNPLIFDGEDIVIRLFAFYFIFAPSWNQLKLAATSISSAGSNGSVITYPVWPLRLFQIQVCLIFICTAIHKSNGMEWLDGTACYYVLRLDDLTRFHLPSWVTDSLLMVKFTTWAVLGFELLAPLLVWSKRFRWPCLILLLVFHVATDYAMNLHMFHWIMLVGWMSFIRFDEMSLPWRKTGWVKKRR